MREIKEQLKRIADLLELTHQKSLRTLRHELHEQKQRANGYKEGYKHQKQYVLKLEDKLSSIIRIAKK